jgi:polysaccharide pyruvyl transferase WcaK-like protein
MKIGILTFHRGANYGGFLQAWSLREAIRGLGHDVEIINYKNAMHYEAEKCRMRLGVRMDIVLKQYRKLRMWENVYPSLTDDRPLITNSANINWSQYDTVVVGSDVVWDYETAKFGKDPVYFGVVPGEGPKKWIAYAPSCGKAPADRLPATQKRGLEQFRAFGVRDQDTENLVKEACGMTATRVVDPTWLFKEAEILDQKDTAPELAVYGYARFSPEAILRIKAIARRHKLKIISYGFYHKWVDKNVLNIEPFAWVDALRRARFVVTGTFHGALYSIRLGKSFCVVGNEWIKNKISAPLEMLGLEDRLVDNGDLIGSVLEAQSEEDTSLPYLKADRYRDESMKFLRDILATQ